MQMTSRVRNSPRCSTSVASSPWRSRRGSRLIVLRRLRRRVVCGRSRQLGLLVVAGYRVLELAHAATEGASDLGQTLRPEDEQRDDEDDDQARNSDLRKHAFKGSGFGYERPMPHSKKPLSEQVVVVTGASSGLGRAI